MGRWFMMGNRGDFGFWILDFELKPFLRVGLACTLAWGLQLSVMAQQHNSTLANKILTVQADHLSGASYPSQTIHRTGTTEPESKIQNPKSKIPLVIKAARILTVTKGTIENGVIVVRD